MVLRVHADWLSGVTGVATSTFHFAGPDGEADSSEGALEAASKVRTFFDSIKALLPSAVSVQVDGTIDVINTATGQITESFPVTSTPVNGGQTGSYARFAGGLVSFNTGARRAGRIVRGRVYIVPLSGAQFSAQGILSDNAVTVLKTAGTTLRSPGPLVELVVYSPPRAGAPGVVTGVASVDVPAGGAVLSSRRD